MSKSMTLRDLLPKPAELNPGESHIYALFSSEGECIYVGQSEHLQNRIYTHLASGKIFDRITYEPCKTDEANMFEADKIVQLKPALNRALPKTQKYTVFTSFKKQVLEMLESNEANFDLAFSNDSRSYLLTDKSNEIIDEMRQLVRRKSV